MRKILAAITAPAFTLALAACGGAADEPEAPATAETPTEAAADEMPAAAESTDDSADSTEATGEADPGDAPDEVAPTPSASARAMPTPTPTPTRVAAAATPPASFTTCGVCHSVNAGENRIGPSLAGVVGRRAGSVAAASYSPAMQDANLTWTEGNLDRYLADPAAVVPGGSMPNPGLDAAQRRAVIDYLKSL